MSMKRRSFLRGLGLGAAALSVPILGQRAKSQVSVPKRVVFFYGGTGSLPGSWEPTGVGGVGDATENQFDLGELHGPLAAYRNRMLLFENLDMVSTRLDPTGASNAHHNGQTHCMTAVNRLTGDLAGGQSIDQAIARALNADGPVTLLPSLEVSASAWRNGSEGAPLYSEAGVRVPVLYEPPEIYARAFPAGSSDPEAAARAARRRELIAGFVTSEHEELIRRLPAADAEKVRQHMDTRSTLEARLGLGTDRAGLMPGMEIISSWDSVDFGYDVPPSGKDAIWQATADLNTELVAAALHADVTRVATVLLHDAPGYTFGYTNGNYESDNPHDLTHKVNDESNWQNGDPDARGAIRRQHLATMEKLAGFLDMLESRIEPDGTTLLDNTLVVYVSQIANGSHSVERLPWFTVGDLQGTLRTGRYLRLGRTEDPESSWRSDGRPHNDLFLSVAQAMDVPMSTFGNDAATGPIDEMFG